MSRRCKRAAAFLLILSILLLTAGCNSQPVQGEHSAIREKVGSLELDYAEEYSVDYFSDGTKLVTTADGSRFLVIPEGGEIPADLEPDIAPLQLPLQNVYLAATAVMSLVDALDGLEAIRLSGTKADGWYNDNARAAMEAGKILFAGKYSEPDYELLLAENCSLAVESTMIDHTSDVKDKLEELGIPVLVDRSGIEKHPLGRTEWIKLYGILLNKEELAEQLFAEQKALMESVAELGDTGKTAVFFYISSAGRVVARKNDDYVSRMIDLAGGHYLFDSVGDVQNNLSTVTLEMETFFASAKDADYIIYNSTIGGAVSSLEELLAKNELLGEFRAVQNGNVWCTGRNMYQEITGLGEMIRSFHMIFSGEAQDEVPYLYHLR